MYFKRQQAPSYGPPALTVPFQFQRHLPLASTPTAAQVSAAGIKRWAFPPVGGLLPEWTRVCRTTVAHRVATIGHAEHTFDLMASC